jgi:hypothetical protein
LLKLIEDGGDQLTQNNIGFGSLFLDEVRIVVATQHNADVRVCLLDDICLFLSTDERRVFVVGVLLVQGVESVASNVSGYTGAFNTLVGGSFFLVSPELT